ncbi:hypothetical protein SISNIDRAFT_463535 [Sistotremastrum niveocremeum HHB9708]|uniref:Uncharacterized protein n=1 Tax=Sistotremastrum niveocremeum HHB9708 TaxID=1314777 RepID=A0A164YBZ2_9AGAM|nr:hypothetical protein SISNIDRAFT_463535 [Sistotremastrum niveocremeum HHB9708]
MGSPGDPGVRGGFSEAEESDEPAASCEEDDEDGGLVNDGVDTDPGFISGGTRINLGTGTLVVYFLPRVELPTEFNDPVDSLDDDRATALGFNSEEREGRRASESVKPFKERMPKLPEAVTPEWITVEIREAIPRRKQFFAKRRSQKHRDERQGMRRNEWTKTEMAALAPDLVEPLTLEAELEVVTGVDQPDLNTEPAEADEGQNRPAGPRHLLRNKTAVCVS